MKKGSHLQCPFHVDFFVLIWKENGTKRQDTLLNIMDDPTNVVAATEEFTNINNDDAVSALDGFVNEDSDG